LAAQAGGVLTTLHHWRLTSAYANTPPSCKEKQDVYFASSQNNDRSKNFRENMARCTRKKEYQSNLE